jgi:hypothetical protein
MEWNLSVIIFRGAPPISLIAPEIDEGISREIVIFDK